MVLAQQHFELSSARKHNKMGTTVTNMMLMILWISLYFAPCAAFQSSCLPPTRHQEVVVSSRSTTASRKVTACTTTRNAATRLEDDPVSTNEDGVKPQQPDMEAFASGYTTVFRELPYQKCNDDIIGQVPSDLVGSYFRAGPAMFSAGSIVPPKTSIVQPRQPPVPDGQDEDRMVRHPMEGDGAVFGITFGEDSIISARFRFVRTVGFTNERKKGARIYKALDATRTASDPIVPNGNDLPLPLIRHHLQPGLNKQRKNTSNTRAIFWGNRLLTLWEGGQPYKLDARALDTEGRSRLGGAIRRDDDPFGGKLSIDSHRKRAVFYGIDHGAKSTDVTLYEFDDKFSLLDRSTASLPGFAAISDFATTGNYAVFIQPAVEVNGMQFLLSKDPSKCLKPTGQSGTLHLVPRAESQRSQVSFELPNVGPSDSNVHFVNAYENGQNVIVDLILSEDENNSKSPLSSKKWPWGRTIEDYQSLASKKSLWRYNVDIASGRIEKTILVEDHCMFGTVNPSVSSQEHRYIYAAVGGMKSHVAPPQGILRYDCKTDTISKWIPEAYEFCGEPVYAPRQGDSGEDSGYILSLLYNGRVEKSEVVILQANNITAGPIARIPIAIAVPHGLFGCFAESATWPAESLERRAKLADKVESRGNMWNEVKSDFSGLGLRLDDMEEYFGDFFN